MSIDKGRNIRCDIDKAGGKNKIIFQNWKNDFIKVYNTIIYKIYIVLYIVKLYTKFTIIFNYW